MDNALFRMKHFQLRQHPDVHPVGTDGILLGAWPEPAHLPGQILDIGTGTGLVALMMAQRFPQAQIDAVELNETAYETAVLNFEASPWGDRLFCYHAAFQEFYEENGERTRYDLITCNPPFYKLDSNYGKEMPQARKMARTDHSLTLAELLYGVYLLLDQHGSFCVIVPHDRVMELKPYCDHYGLEVTRRTDVKGTPDAAVKRTLLCIQFSQNLKGQPAESLLMVRNHDGSYTREFMDLTREFYLDL